MSFPWPWNKKTEAAPPALPPPEPVDIAALVRSAATEAANAAATQAKEAVKEEFAEIARSVAVSPMPGAPMFSLTKSPVPIYHYDHPIWWSTPQDPHRRPGSLVTVETLRRLADTYDVLRSCIQHLKREVRAVPIEIVPKNGKETRGNRQAVKQAEEFFATPGGLGGFKRKRSRFEGAVLEDLIVVGAGAVFYHPTRGGGIYQVLEIDAATIRPRTDAFGWPGPGEAQYEQWIQGVLLNGYTDQEVGYLGLDICTRSYDPYPWAQVEWLVNVINSALNIDLWNQNWLTKGTTPSDEQALPEGWTPDQVREWQQHWDAMLAGDHTKRQQTKFVPGGTQRVGGHGRKDQDFDKFELWLLRRTCAIMGVQPASIGYAGEQYKVSQTDSMESTTEFGAGVLLAWRKEFYDDILERLELGQLEVKDVRAREEDAKSRADRNKVLIGVPTKTINEGRIEEGDEPIEGGDEILVPNTMVPLRVVLAAAAPAQADPSDDPTAGDPDPAPGANGAPSEDTGESDDGGDESEEEAVSRALGQWRKKAENRIRRGQGASCPFVSDAISAEDRRRIEDGLPVCKHLADVRRLFGASPAGHIIEG